MVKDRLINIVVDPNDGQTDVGNDTFEIQVVYNQTYLQFQCRSLMLEQLEHHSHLEHYNLEQELCSWCFVERYCSF